jgi:hypothetical protein
MTEDDMQACLEAGDLGGRPSEVRAIEKAFTFGRKRALADVIAELDSMSCSMSARDAAVDFRQSYEADLA